MSSNNNAITKDTMRDMIKAITLPTEVTLSDVTLSHLVDKTMKKMQQFSTKGVEVWCSNVKHAREEETLFYKIVRMTVNDYVIDIATEKY